MLTLPRRQSMTLLILVLTIAGAALWVGRPASEAAAPPPAQSAPPTPPVTGGGRLTLSLSPALSLPILSFQFGAGRNVSSTGSTSNLSLSEATVTLAYSPADPQLLQAIGEGDFMASATVLSSDKNATRLWTMTNVAISGAAWSRGTKEGSVSLSLNYATIRLTTYDPKGSVVGSYCVVNRPGSDCNDT